jgi:hypothetical protein
VLEVYLSLGHQVLVYLLAMIPSTGKPPSHRALVQAEGGHNGLEGAAMAEEGYYDGYHLRSLVHAKEGSAFGGGKEPALSLPKGLLTNLAAIALLLLAMDHDMPFSSFASSRAGWVVTELGLRVHRPPPENLLCWSRLEGCTIDPCYSIVNHLSTIK